MFWLYVYGLVVYSVLGGAYNVRKTGANQILCIKDRWSFSETPQRPEI